jgi:hypothetical protein
LPQSAEKIACSWKLGTNSSRCELDTYSNAAGIHCAYLQERDAFLRVEKAKKTATTPDRGKVTVYKRRTTALLPEARH